MDLILKLKVADNAKPDEIDYALRACAILAGHQIISGVVPMDGTKMDLMVETSILEDSHIRILKG